MELLSTTGQTKTGEIRVDKAIGALLISTSGGLSSITNETITVFVERADGANVRIATNIPLLPFMALSTIGDSAIIERESGVTSALCELSEEGSIHLEENDGIKFQFNNLKPTNIYTVNGLEYPVSTTEIISVDRKVMTDDSASKSFDVEMFDVVAIKNFTAIQEMHIQYENGHVVKFTPIELEALSDDFDPIKVVIDQKPPMRSIPNYTTLPLTGATRIDLYKDQGVVELYLKSDNQ